MRRVWTLVATLGVTAAGVMLPATASARVAAPAIGADERAVRSGAVTGVSVIPSSGRADIVIAVDSGVTVADFTLAGPDRIVVDLTGAALRMPPRFYDKVVRGGVKNVRFAQYKPDVVRVVVELDAKYKYEVARGDSEVRISVTGEKAPSFAAWHAGTPAVPGAVATASVAAAPRADTPKPEATTVAKAEPAKAEPAMPEAPAPMVAVAPAPSARRTDAGMPPAAQPAAPMQQSTQPRITVTYQDADIRDVLAAFAAFSGRTIVVGKSVGGQVTAEIRDQPWDVALQAILSSQGLAAAEDATGIITVDSYANISSKQATEPLVTQMVQINYASAVALVPTISSLLARDCSQGMAGGGGGGSQGQGAPGGGQVVNGCIVRGTVVADSTTNTLLVTDVQSRLPDLISYIRDLDIRTPQVAIKAKIIFVSRTDIEQLGVSYDLGSNAGFFNRIIPRNNANGTPYDRTQVPAVVQLGGEALAGVTNANRNFAGTAAINLFYSTMVGKFSLTSFIDALQEVRLADTQAEPNIVTQDRRSARILVGEETPIRVIDASSGASGAARANVTFKETGIILNVTPRIAPNRQVEMTISAEQSQLQSAQADLGYTFLKRQASTQLLVADGETAVLGGLTITQVTRAKSGIPFLVDLPFVGRLFGETQSNEQKQDLLILITPHIIDEGEAVRSRAPQRGA